MEKHHQTTGQGAAEQINPTVEDAYWRENHDRQAFARDSRYEDYAAAYRAGYEGYRDLGTRGKSYEETEADLRRTFAKSGSQTPWDNAQFASRAAWERARQNYRVEPAE